MWPQNIWFHFIFIWKQKGESIHKKCKLVQFIYYDCHLKACFVFSGKCIFSAVFRSSLLQYKSKQSKHQHSLCGLEGQGMELERKTSRNRNSTAVLNKTKTQNKWEVRVFAYSLQIISAPLRHRSVTQVFISNTENFHW